MKNYYYFNCLVRAHANQRGRQHSVRFCIFVVFLAKHHLHKVKKTNCNKWFRMHNCSIIFVFVQHWPYGLCYGYYFVKCNLRIRNAILWSTMANAAKEMCAVKRDGTHNEREKYGVLVRLCTLLWRDNFNIVPFLLARSGVASF